MEVDLRTSSARGRRGTLGGVHECRTSSSNNRQDSSHSCSSAKGSMGLEWKPVPAKERRGTLGLAKCSLNEGACISSSEATSTSENVDAAEFDATLAEGEQILGALLLHCRGVEHRVDSKDGNEQLSMLRFKQPLTFSLN